MHAEHGSISESTNPETALDELQSKHTPRSLSRRTSLNPQGSQSQLSAPFTASQTSSSSDHFAMAAINADTAPLQHMLVVRSPDNATLAVMSWATYVQHAKTLLRTGSMHSVAPEYHVPAWPQLCREADRIITSREEAYQLLQPSSVATSMPAAPPMTNRARDFNRLSSLNVASRGTPSIVSTTSSHHATRRTSRRYPQSSTASTSASVPAPPSTALAANLDQSTDFESEDGPSLLR